MTALSNFKLRQQLWSSIVILAFSFIAISVVQSADNSPRVEGELIIQIFDNQPPRSLAEDFSGYELKPKKLLSRRLNIWLYEYASTGLKAADQEQLLAGVKDHNEVALAQFNHVVTKRATFPNDPSFNNQWGLHNTAQLGGIADADVDAVEAWDTTTGGATALADEIVIAVIDGGVDLNHSDLRLWKNLDETPGNGIDDDGNGYIDDYDGWNAYSSTGNIPGDNHGTHVAGICAARGNNGIGVSGVNWNAKVLPVAGSSGNESIVVEAYGYVLELRQTYNETNGASGAFIVSTNSSFGVDFGDPADFPIWCAMYDSMGAAGIISAAATANLNIDIDQVGDVPTACGSDFLLSVTNTTNSDNKNGGAAYGATTIDLGAPGTTIYSTLQGNSYGNLTGTSMATPHVAGAVALLFAAACPEFISQYHIDPPTFALQVKQALLDGTDPIAALSGITVTGGRLNLFNGVNLMRQILCGLSISHTPLTDVRDSINDYEVTCQITSDTSLVTDSLLLYYNSGSGWLIDTLAPTATPDEFNGFIPAQLAGTIIEYYVFAQDMSGAVDSTTVFTFKVIDYAVSMFPDSSSVLGPTNDTVWHQFTVTNEGVLQDSYQLSVGGTSWNTAIWDEQRNNVIDSTADLLQDSSFAFQLSVVVPPSVFGESDTATVTATSKGNNSLSVQSIATTTSAGTPLNIPFSDNFPISTPNAANWVEVKGATINSGGLNIPSPPYSLNLDGDPGGADTIVSQVIDLEGEVVALLRYQYQRTGGGDSPEAGDDLFIEYLDSTGNWQLLQQHLGSGPDMTQFEEMTMSLPVDALHSVFRFRLRCTGTAGAFDDWFVDDIFLGLPPDYELALSPQQQQEYGSSGDTISYLININNRGLLDDAYDLTALNGSWSAAFYDETGTNPITATGLVSSDDSVKVTVKIAIPDSAETSDADTVTIIARSQSDSTVTDSGQLITVSSGPPGSFPWFEPFPDSVISSFRWPVNKGAEISTQGLAPPSPLYSLNLDGGNDTVVSQIIDLSGRSDIVLSYFYQRGGGGNYPEAGDDLTVAYKNDVGAWADLQTYLGEGPPMSTFASAFFSLPSDAAHSSFQIRLASVGTCVGCDDWFVDDIRVDFSSAITVSPASIDVTMDQLDTLEIEIVIDNTGLGKLSWNASILPVFIPPVNSASIWESGLAEPAMRNYPDGFFEFIDVKGVDDYRTGFQVNRGAGGPDNFGYYWIDSDEPGGPAFAWLDVTATGTNIIAGLDDDSLIGPFDIGFDFPFYDSSYNQFYLGSNGLIGFNPTNLESRFKTSIPNTSTPNNFVAWLWDDLDPTNTNNPGAQIFLDTTGGKCVVQFVDYPEYAALAGDVINAEVILEPNGAITLQYLSIDSGFDVLSGAVGIENPLGTDGLEIAFLSPFLKDSLAVSIMKPANWFSLPRKSGQVASLQSDTVSLILNTNELTQGVYQAEIIISSNDPDSVDNPVRILINLTVTDQLAFICGDVDDNGEFEGILELTYLVDFIFRSGPPPADFRASDVDGVTGFQGILELTYLVDYLFRSGPPPVCP